MAPGIELAEMFLAHLERRANPHTARRRRESLPFAETARRLRDIDRRYVAKTREWTAAELAEPIEFAFVDGGEGVMTREDIVLHLASHSTYHRGFVSTLLYPLAGDSKASDLTVFLRDVRPGIVSEP